jgi:calcium/calmodulin-dependent protein kinase kinase 2
LPNPENDYLTEKEGTALFMSPEMHNPNFKGYRGKPADIWALGVCLYCLIYMKMPFDGTA